MQFGQEPLLWGGKRWIIFKSQSNNRGRKKESIQNWEILKRTWRLPILAWTTGALCYTGGQEPCKNKSGSLHCSFFICANHSAMGVTSSLHNTLFIPGHGISLQTMAWHGCFHEHHETHILQKVVHIPARSEMWQDHPSPAWKFYAKSTDGRHHQTQCLHFLQDSSQGRQSEQDFLWVLVWLKILLRIFLQKEDAAGAFSSASATPQTLPVPTPLCWRAAHCWAEASMRLAVD